MRILITGGLGYIGSKLIRWLPEWCEITVLDNLATQRYNSLFNLTRPINFIEADITDVGQTDEACRNQDFVIHLAAETDAATSHLRVDDVVRVNVIGLINVIESCVQNNCYLIFPSTTSVYGKSEGIVNEETILDPQSTYAESKMQGEKYILEAKGLKATILRLGTIYGVSPGMRFHTVVNKFCWQAVMGQPLTVWETALNQKRPYLDLEDACWAILFIIKAVLINNNVQGQIYNIVTGNHLLSEIVETIQIYCPAKIKLVESEIMNQLSYEVSSEKFIHELDFVILGQFRQGALDKNIKQTLQLLGVHEKDN